MSLAYLANEYGAISLPPLEGSNSLHQHALEIGLIWNIYIGLYIVESEVLNVVMPIHCTEVDYDMNYEMIFLFTLSRGTLSIVENLRV